eukprot:scaffold265946_cov35-Attheya_sp.AAC.1
MKEIFTLRGLSGVIYKDTIGLKKKCAGKVDIMVTDGRHCIGYILEEIGELYWRVQLVTNHIITLKKPHLDRDTGMYLFPSDNNDGTPGYVITSFWPIQFLIYTSGH